ncbi:PRC-barrel domain-containing protein [Devosia nitrariae]|uniref:PRC-barrel domain-containing protein n=1 Tax=Devosia nitrariae TaxID=2071872 RepID=A0ABQ5W9D1_9HYPH|nr:PRC-barrel domain-containing protein [Devosia nitrariae]GLQ56709.1 hypothetical protein GCM10010862_39680 [Devosia nitrariae]
MTPRILCALALLAAISSSPAAQEAPLPSAPRSGETSELEAVGLTPPTILSEGHTMASGEILALDFFGRSIFASDAENAEMIGTVEDLVIAPSGTVSSVILDVGSFLDTPGKSIAVDFQALVPVPRTDGETRWVLETTREALTLAPVFRRPDEAAAN